MTLKELSDAHEALTELASLAAMSQDCDTAETIVLDVRPGQGHAYAFEGPDAEAAITTLLQARRAALRRRLEEGGVELPADDRLLEELRALGWKVVVPCI